jgi:hypothetical protein
MNHAFFDGIDFKTIINQEPPSSERISFKLSEIKKIQVNYLPKNVKIR